MSSNPEHIYNSDPRSYRYSLDANFAALSLKKLDDAFEQDRKSHESNLMAIENNVAIRAEIEAMMDGFCVPRTWREVDKKSRAHGIKYKWNDAGYIGDMNREIPVLDGWDEVCQTYNRLKTAYGKYLTDLLKKAEDERKDEVAKRDAEIAKRKSDMDLARALIRYNLSENCGWPEVLEYISSMDQKIDLAISMIQTRRDWSDGAWRVRNSLNTFVPVNPEETELYNDVTELLENFDDGRVFRSHYDSILSDFDQSVSTDIYNAINAME